MMNTKPLGTTGLTIPPLCFGGNVFGWTLDQDASFAMLDHMVDLGWTFIDTADMYSRWAPGNSGGESETILGNWFASRGRRNEITLASKLGMDMGEGRKGLRAGYIVKAIEDSLRRLQTDRIDLYQAHQDDPDTPQQETMEAFSKLLDAGKVRALGASNFSAGRLQGALDTARSEGIAQYQTLQPLYNLMERDGFERDLQALCVREDIAVIPFYSLASGFLSGKYRTPADAGKSARGPGVIDKYLNERGLRVLAELDALSAELDTSPGSIAIAWVLHQPAIAAPICSATSEAQLQELTAAASISLDAQALARLDRASSSEA